MLDTIIDPGLLTVVISNFNRCDDLRAALQSVGNQDYPNVEIIVVDNASIDNSRAMLRSEFHDVQVIALTENIGMDGYSVGFRQAKGEFIFQMDNDSLMPEATVLTEVVKRFWQSPQNLAVVATRVEEFKSGATNIDELRHRDKRRGPINTGGFHAGGVGFRRVFLDRVGYYNRDVFLYASESFLQMKFLAEGFQVLYYPEILMLHKSSHVARSRERLYYEFRNRYWLMRYFAPRRQQIRFLPSIILHDLIYALSEKAPKSLMRALRDGFGTMPASLRPRLHSLQPMFVAKINEFGAQFRFFSLLRHIKKHLNK